MSLKGKRRIFILRLVYSLDVLIYAFIPVLKFPISHIRRICFTSNAGNRVH
jgi:hypothetical protein